VNLAKTYIPRPNGGANSYVFSPIQAKRHQPVHRPHRLQSVPVEPDLFGQHPRAQRANQNAALHRRDHSRLPRQERHQIPISSPRDGPTNSAQAL
jgi:hypothetical protein